VTDAYIIAAFLDMMQMEDVDSKSKHMPVFSLLTDDQKCQWLNTVSDKLINTLHILDVEEATTKLRHELCALDGDDKQIQAMKMDDTYKCALCTKTYTSESWLRKHLQRTHHWQFHIVSTDVSECNALQIFLFMSLLFRDTCDAYRLGDGDRILLNAHFEWLFDSALRHSKYKIWLWRMIAYCISILGVNKSFEYKWNMCVNLKGGTANNIPNDNCVELQVRNIKAHLNAQGANKSFDSARIICLTTQVVDSVKENLIRTTRAVKSGRHRPEVDKSCDVSAMVKCIRGCGYVVDFRWKSFSSFRNPLQCIPADDLHSWMNKQKQIADLLL